MSRLVGVFPSSGFAALLRAHRLHLGMTQEQFAAKARVGVRTLRDLERGRSRPQRATAELLAAALGLRGAARGEFFLAAVGRGDGAPELVESGASLSPPVLIGRDAELASLAEALRHAALVTLVGVAGVGKTSLAWMAAHRVATRHPGGVAGIVITDASTEADTLANVASAFGVARVTDLPAHFAGRPALLLIDAVERSSGPAASALRWLRGHAPSLRVLATGRRPTGLAGEYVWPVTPLECPPPGVVDADQLARYPAAELFLDRLRAVRSGPLEPADLEAVGELVRRLAGLPLALELGAARGRILEVREILDRYGDRVLDLSQQSPGGETTTLRDEIAGSYRLLERAERAALRRLAYFHHRWSVELAEQLLADDPEVGQGLDVVAVLDRLVGLGLVAVRGAGPARFRMLDVVRDFAMEQSEASGEAAASRDRHAAVFARYAARTAPELVGGGLPEAAARLDVLSGDLRSALVWFAGRDPCTALYLAAKLPRWWRLRGRDREGRAWLRRLLDDPATAQADPVVRAWAALGLAQLAAEHGDGYAELPGLASALQTFIRYGRVSGQLAARNQLCILHQAYGDYEAAREHAEAVLRLATQHSRTRDIVVAQNNLTWHDIRVGDLVEAQRRLATVQRLAADLGEDRLWALAHANLAEVARLDGRYAEAVTIGRRALAPVERLGDPRQRWRVMGCIALALAQSGRVDEARAAMANVRDTAVIELIEAYLEVAEGNRAAAAERFSAAAGALAGRHDVRDVVEALVGVVACTDDRSRRARVRDELDDLCRRSAVSLLPRERALVDG